LLSDYPSLQARSNKTLHLKKLSTSYDASDHLLCGEMTTLI
jgi:hypothetical protein